MFSTWETQVAIVWDVGTLCRDDRQSITEAASIGSACGLSSFLLSNQRRALQAIYLPPHVFILVNPLVELDSASAAVYCT
jgi:cell division inhibitor SulA